MEALAKEEPIILAISLLEKDRELAKTYQQARSGRHKAEQLYFLAKKTKMSLRTKNVASANWLEWKYLETEMIEASVKDGTLRKQEDGRPKKEVSDDPTLPKVSDDPTLPRLTLDQLGISRQEISANRPLLKLEKPEFKRILAEKIEANEEEITLALMLRKAKGEPHVSHNSGNNEWYTPSEYIEAARQVMGGIDLDPASSKTANEIVKATKYFTAEDNALNGREWKGRVWMNPPYSGDLVGRFIEILIKYYSVIPRITQAIVLVNNATETSWSQRLAIQASAKCEPAGRIKYLDSTGKPANSPLQGQQIFYLGRKVKEFEKSFCEFGIVWKR